MTITHRAPSRTFRSLRSPNFRLFFIGQAISATGTWMQSVTIGIVVLHITGSGVALGMTTVAHFGPLLLIGPWAGVLSDRFDLHRLLVGVNAAGGVVAAIFAAVVLTGAPPLWSIYVLAAATGLVQAVENPVRRVFVTELVDDDLLANATGLNSTVMISAEAIGLTLAGIVLGGPGAGLPTSVSWPGWRWRSAVVTPCSASLPTPGPRLRSRCPSATP